MSLQHARSLAAPFVALLSVAATGAGSAQRVFAYTEPSPCTVFFQPIEKVTHHAGGLFEVGWYINFPQYGPVWYYGKPNPVISDDGTKNGPIRRRTLRALPTGIICTPPRTWMQRSGGTSTNMEER